MPDFSSRGTRRQLSILDASLLGLGVLLVAVAASGAFGAWSDLQRTRRAADEVRREADAVAARVQALQGRREAGGPTLSSQVLLSGEAPPPRVLAAVSSVLPADVRLEGIGLTYGRRLEVELKVAARDPKAYDAFLKRLSESAWFDEIVPGPETREGEVHASVVMRYRGEEVR
jgi:anti-sigma factor RsiW